MFLTLSYAFDHPIKNAAHRAAFFMVQEGHYLYGGDGGETRMLTLSACASV